MLTDGEHSQADPAVLRLGEALGEVIDGATRVEWGRRCKRLLDLGRSRYLAARGYAVRLQTYVSQTVTPENRLITAWPRVCEECRSDA